MGTIRLNSIRIYAYHGCLVEESIIGGNYIVDIAMDIDFSEASAEDDLSLTIDYVQVSSIVHEEMAIRSKLIETVADRVADRLRATFGRIEKVWVKITKLAAPIPGQVESVSVETIR